MKNILLNVSMLGLLASSMQSQALQQNSSSHMKLIGAGLAGVTTLGGLGSALYFYNKTRQFKKPLQKAEHNVRHLTDIQLQGKAYKPEDRQRLSNSLGQLKFNRDEQEYLDRDTLINFLESEDYLVDETIPKAFEFERGRRNDMQKTQNMHRGWHRALAIADFADKTLEKETAKKDELEQQDNEYQREHAQCHKSYTSWSLSIASFGVAIFSYLLINKKKS
jgi:hypothetical protein